MPKEKLHATDDVMRVTRNLANAIKAGDQMSIDVEATALKQKLRGRKDLSFSEYHDLEDLSGSLAGYSDTTRELLDCVEGHARDLDPLFERLGRRPPETAADRELSDEMAASA